MSGRYADISSFQSLVIDWQSYILWSNQDDGKVRIALRASEGTGVYDKNYSIYRSHAEQYNFDLIIHDHYCYPQYNKAVAEAQYFASIIGQIRPQDVVMLDVEEQSVTAQWVLDFMGAMVNLGYPNAVIYSYISRIQSNLQDSRLAQYPLILAEWTYDITKVPQAVSPWSSLYAWQYTNKENVPGIGVCDSNLFLGENVTMPTIQLNKDGCVLDILRTNQLMEGEPDLCGPWTIASLRIAGLPDQGPRGSVEDADSWTDSQVALYNYTPANFPGSSTAMMYKFLTDSLDPQSKQRNLHFWEMIGTDPVRIRRALEAGYPVAITAWEPNIIEKTTGKQAYTGHWSNTANHILPIVGIDKDGDYICADQLNNSFQGYWPVVYLASKLNPSWACIIQVVGPDPSKPWLQPIPSDDPLVWPSNFNAQLFVPPPPVPPVPPAPSDKQTMFDQEWSTGGLYPTGTGIAKLAFETYLTPEFHGCPVSQEYDMGTLKVQRVNNGIWKWDLTTSKGEYFPYH